MQTTREHLLKDSLQIQKKFVRPPSPTLAVHQDMSQKIKRSEEVFALGFGGNPLPPPEVLTKAYESHIHKNYYPPVAGIPELQESLCGYLKKHYNLNISPDGVFIFPGSKEALYQTLQVLQGDLLLPQGSWVSYEPQGGILGKKVHWLPTSFADDYKLVSKVLETGCLSLGSEQKLLILNSPNNPISHVYNIQELKRIAEVCDRQNVITIFDSIYGHPKDYDGHEYKTLAHICPHRTLLTGGLSKVFSGGGWRLGFLAVPSELDPKGDLKRSLSFLMSETISGVNVPLQFAAARAYQGGDEIEKYLEVTKNIFTLATRYMWQRLTAMGLNCSKPQGGFYVFPNFKPYRDLLNKKGIFTAKSLNHLLRQKNIYVLCGEDFGVPGSELAFRMAAVDFDGPWVYKQVSENPSLTKDIIWGANHLMPKLVKACDRIEELLGSLS